MNNHTSFLKSLQIGVYRVLKKGVSLVCSATQKEKLYNQRKLRNMFFDNKISYYVVLK